MADLGILGGILFAVSAYGFFTRKSWAFLLSVIGIVLALLGSWFINVLIWPRPASNLLSSLLALLIIYFLLMRGVGNVSWSRTLLALLTGIAYIFCFMNGVASSSRIITQGAPIFVLVQSCTGLPCLVGLGHRGIAHESQRLDASRWAYLRMTELVVGIPLAFVTAQQLGRFSLFALGPIACLALIVILIWPGVWERWSGRNKNRKRQTGSRSGVKRYCDLYHRIWTSFVQ